MASKMGVGERKGVNVSLLTSPPSRYNGNEALDSEKFTCVD